MRGELSASESRPFWRVSVLAVRKQMFKYKHYPLELKEPFGTAHGLRTHTDGMLVALGRGDNIGYGEVYLPPYYRENRESFESFFSLVDESRLLSFGDLETALHYLHGLTNSDSGAKTALDIALHDLFGKETGQPVSEFYREELELYCFPKERIVTSYTIGLDEKSIMLDKARRAKEFEILKIKLGGEDDVGIVSAIRDQTDQRLFVDANQAWRDEEQALSVASELISLGVELIEQPFCVSEFQKTRALRDASPVPVIADEDVQNAGDIKRLADSFDGINIKLMKAGGIRNAVAMLKEARRLGISVLIGCMTESSIGISAAAGIAAFADWCDLDGNLLIKNDACEAVKTIDGVLEPSDVPGIGITNDAKLREIFGAID